MDLYFKIAVIFIILLLVAYLILFLLYRKCKVKYASAEKAILIQLSEKTDFFSNMTHELKTPLSVILGAIQLIEMKRSIQPEDDNNFYKNIRIIKCNCYRLLRLINNLLDLTKLEAGYLELKPVNCDLRFLLEEIVQSVMPYAIQKQLDMSYNMPSESISTAVDIEKIERIMLNLLSNSIKFTKPGGTISISSYTAGDRALISVRDSGTGISAANQEKLFTRFNQLENSPTAENKGSGIGLSMVKSFVGLHQGNIRVISEQGKGCEFIIDLPIRHVDDKAGNLITDTTNNKVAEEAKIEFSVFNPMTF